MEPVKVLIQYNGEWDSENKFCNFNVYGVLVRADCRFSEFVDEINNQLKIDQNFSVELKYSLKDRYPPKGIDIDMSLQFYLNLIKLNSDVTQYPLCIALKENLNSGSCSKPLYDGCDEIIHDLDVPHTIEMLTTGNGEDYEGTQIDQITVIYSPLHEQIAENQIYKDKEILMSALKNHAMRENFQFNLKRSSATRYSLVCIESNCAWCFKSSSLNTSRLFIVRKFHDEHTCPPEERLISMRRVNSLAIGKLIADKFESLKSVYTPGDIIRDMKKTYGVDLNYMTAWRSKEKALQIVRGNLANAYGKIPSYLYMLKRTNPGSVTKLHKSEDGCFMYVYVALYPSIRGWYCCRPIVVVDGSFLKSTYRGTVITACTQDATS